jgi:hypothetical protein
LIVLIHKDDLIKRVQVLVGHVSLSLRASRAHWPSVVLSQDACECRLLHPRKRVRKQCIVYLLNDTSDFYFSMLRN